MAQEQHSVKPTDLATVVTKEKKKYKMRWGDIVITGFIAGLGSGFGAMLGTFLDNNTAEGINTTLKVVLAGLGGGIGGGLGNTAGRAERSKWLLPAALAIAAVTTFIYLVLPHQEQISIYEQASPFLQVTAAVVGLSIFALVIIIGITVVAIKLKKYAVLITAVLLAALAIATPILTFLTVQSDINGKLSLQHYASGNNYFYKKEYASAIAEYNIALQLDPYSSVYHMRRAEAYADEGDINQAIADYDFATHIKKNNDYSYSNRARAYAALAALYNKQGQYQQAASSYTEAISLIINKDFTEFQLPGYYVGLGNAYYGMKEYDQAITYYSKVIATGREFAYTDAMYGRGLTYKAKGERDKALKDFQDVIRYAPNTDTAAKAKQQLQELGVQLDERTTYRGKQDEA